MLIEPTESETLEEIDRFCDAMIQIRKEAEDIITGKQPKDNNLLKNSPHPLSLVIASDKDWNRLVVSHLCLHSLADALVEVLIRVKRLHILCRGSARRSSGRLFLA
jgi:glycine cleavage system protein P-like pyridoxal-binding family